ncbi:MAG: Asp-tRNA(Asn)/Glu-tRNA(Gln) amidotransferase subunit GatA [Deltaproteobacteria bacterium]|nr:Asp-tRNA(Asn)/Glu-tRNA(Gln) amidotransferase subunit GatA [Deltaproteobacteria bacterium]
MEISRLGIFEIKNLLLKREVSCTELVRAYIERAKRLNPVLNCFITISEESALIEAKKTDDLITKRRDNIRPLEGLPVAIKDIFVTQNIRTTCGSKILENFIPPFDATIVRRLKDAGAIIFGKLNMDEFAMGSSNENSYFGPVRNPFDLSRSPGGSSGGSAAAVAAGLTPASIGTDTGGSIRQPAAFCGIIGMKPSYGRVSRYGMIAFASSLDQAGPMCRSVRDCAILLESIAGNDPKDSTTMSTPVPRYTDWTVGDPSEIRVGILRPEVYEGINPEVFLAYRGVIEFFERSGVPVTYIELPHIKYAVAVYYIIATSEASSNLARYDGVKYGLRAKEYKNLKDMYLKTRLEGFGSEVKRRIILGTFALSSGYYDAFFKKASQVRRLIANDFYRSFSKVNTIIMPVTPDVAFKLGEKISDPLSMYLSDIFTIPVNLAGLPSISMPAGKNKDGLPIGIQFIGKPFDEHVLINVAAFYEKESNCMDILNEVNL